MDPVERNHRATQALMGLVLVSALFMTYLSGKLEEKLTHTVEALVISNTGEYLDSNPV